MQVVVTENQMEVYNPLRSHVKKWLARAITKCFEHAIEVSGNFPLHGQGKQALSKNFLQVERNIQMQNHAEVNKAEVKFEFALELIAKRWLRYKSRLLDHRKAFRKSTGVKVQEYFLTEGNCYEEEQITEEEQLLVSAKITTEIDNLTVGKAAIQMELAKTYILVFQNCADVDINDIYRRSDGNPAGSTHREFLRRARMIDGQEI